jgi:molybdate/tungstate transport system permease protein
MVERLTWLKEKSPFIIVSFILGILLVLFLIVPIIGSIASGAKGLPAALTDTRTLSAIWTSFYCAFIAMLLMLILGVPFAYLFTRREFPGKKVLDSLIDMPNYPIGSAFSSLGIGFIDTVWGIVAAMAFVSAPFMIRSAQEAFQSIDPAMEKSARGLGATRFKVFRHVTLPLASRGILTGCVLTWARAISEFGAVILIAYFPQTAPVYLYDVFVSQGLSAALPITALLILLAIVVLVIFRFVVSKPTKKSVYA